MADIGQIAALGRIGGLGGFLVAQQVHQFRNGVDRAVDGRGNPAAAPAQNRNAGKAQHGQRREDVKQRRTVLEKLGPDDERDRGQRANRQRHSAGCGEVSALQE